MKDGITLITEERERQVLKEGWTAEHDDKYIDGQLADAAACYAMNPPSLYYIGNMPDIWPFHNTWWKPSPENRIRDLVKAGALILAEIDRLQRKEGKT